MAVKAKAKTRASKATPAAKAAKGKSPAKAAKGKSPAKAAKGKSPAKAASPKTQAKKSKASKTQSDKPQIQTPVAAIETDPAWLQAEQDYANHDIAVAEIAKRLGLSSIQLSTEAKKRGWRLRTKKRAAPETAAIETPKPTGLVRSVFKTIDGELRKLDLHKGTTSQDRERASRALSQMVNSLEKAVEMQSRIDKSNAKGSKAKNKEHLAHADDLRRAIAERLERINSKRDAGKQSAGTE